MPSLRRAQVEATLRQRLDKQVRRPLSLRSLVDRALETGQIKEEAWAFVDDWIPLRNRIVHSVGRTTEIEATAGVEGVRQLLQK